MQIGYFARKNLIPSLMVWVDGSRMKRHLPPMDFNFFALLNLHTIQINLSYFDTEYREKHIEPNLSSYCTLFVSHMKPVLRDWAIKNQMSEVRFQLRFNSHYIYNTEIVFVVF